MFDKLRPLHDKILVKKLEDNPKTTGGLYIPASATDNKAQQATVIATGNGKVLTDGSVLPLTIKVGDTVFIGRYTGTDAGNDYLIVREEEILGVIEKTV